MRDYYRILGIRPDATQDEIREAWTFSVKAFHPDKFAGSSSHQNATAQERTKAINEAYELLSDSVKRAGYDREYARKPRTHPASQPPRPPPPPPSTPPPPRHEGIRTERCGNCGGRVFGHSIRDKLGIFCSTVCRNNFKHPGFCKACISASTPISAGDNFRINGIGNSFFGAKDQCETCGSIVQTLWLCIFFVPIVPSGKFRVKYVAPGSYLSRKLPKIHSAAQPPPTPPPQPPPRPTPPPTTPPQKVSKWVGRTLLILSIGLLLLIGGAAYYFQKSNDVLGRSMDDLVQEFAAAVAGMSRQLSALDEKNVLEPYVLSNQTSLEAEVRKRIEGQRIIEKFRNDLPHTLDAMRQKAASYNISDEQKRVLVSRFEKARPNFFLESERICNLLEEREKSELDFLNFMASASYNESELKDGKVLLHTPRATQLANRVENSAKAVEAAIQNGPTNLNNLKTNIRRLSQ